ncbi:MAG TPA: apolipoprotein N-acyltransferase [Caulobacterales bacterium]|nr:apolipoprotein N-acyltransferase [Caulobacterales bacterium]
MGFAAPEASLSRIERWFAAQPRWRRYVAALLAGALATLGHAPFQIVPAFAVAITALMWLLDASMRGVRAKGWFSRALSGFATLWWFGFGHFTSGLYWIMSAFAVDAQTFGAFAVPAWLALAGGLALFWGLGGAFAALIWTPDIRRVAGFTIAVLASEWLRGHVFGGFPWLLPGYIWMPGEPVSQLASIFGIYGLSAVTLLVSAAPATIADGDLSAGRRFAPMVVAGLAIGLAWGWGAQRLAHAPIEPPGAQPVVRVADSGLSQAEKWRFREGQEEYVLRRYLRASGDPESDHADIVVWPEGAIPTVHFWLLDNPAFLDEIGQGLGNRALITGFSRCSPAPECDAYLRGERGSDGLRFYNSATVIDGVSGRARIDMTQVYDKHRLVPWGEFIPLWSVFSSFNIAPLQEIGAGFTPGPPPTRLVIPDAPPAVILICYEAIFPGMVPRGEERPGWIISISNDAWFGNGTGPYQHYVAARYRAIEEGLPMARAASGGVSGIVDSFGRVVRETHRRGDAAEAQLPPSLPPTPHAVWGFLLIPMLAAVIAALRFAPILATTRSR